MPVRVRYYRGFEKDREALPEPVQERLNSFFSQVYFNPDDDSILEVCGHGKDATLAYPLGEGWIVYWRVIRDKTGLTTLRLPRPIRVEIIGFHRFPEFEKLKVGEGPQTSTG